MSGKESPSPHNFSRSPVKKVFCSINVDKEQISFTVPAPYPGWKPIQEELTGRAASLSDCRRVTRCILQYTDCFFLETEEFCRIIKNISPDIFHIHQTSGTEYEISLALPDSEFVIIIRSTFTIQKQSKWTLVFTLETVKSHRFSMPDDILSWFDGAHAAIHNLFDQIVPVHIVDLIR
jgi:uncharacterized protein (TIGR04255 family)